MDSLKALDPERPIREAVIAARKNGLSRAREVRIARQGGHSPRAVARPRVAKATVCELKPISNEASAQDE
jgi:hypothetical protein